MQHSDEKCQPDTILGAQIVGLEFCTGNGELARRLRRTNALASSTYLRNPPWPMHGHTLATAFGRTAARAAAGTLRLARSAL